MQEILDRRQSPVMLWTPVPTNEVFILFTLSLSINSTPPKNKRITSKINKNHWFLLLVPTLISIEEALMFKILLIILEDLTACLSRIFPRHVPREPLMGPVLFSFVFSYVLLLLPMGGVLGMCRCENALINMQSNLPGNN